MGTSNWSTSLRHTADLDFSKLPLIFPTRIALIVAAICAVLITRGDANMALTVAIGATFVGIVDSPDSMRVRLNVFFRAGLLMFIGTMLGLLVSGQPIAHVVVVGIVAFVFGYIGVIGPRAAVVGVLALVLFTVFAGTPERGWSIADTLIELVAGMLCYVVIAVVTTPLLKPLVKHHSVFPAFHTVSIRDIPKLHHSVKDAYVRHGIRLAVAIMFATILSFILDYPHSYWIPMTVAWIAKPDLTGTVSKTLYRVIGTSLGVAVCILVLATHHPITAVTIALAAIGTWIATSFLWVNYSIAVAGITMEVLSLFYLDSEGLSQTAPARIISTIIAGIIVVAASYLWRTREPEQP